jgi:ureidoacrylate peracid hydrolase
MKMNLDAEPEPIEFDPHRSAVCVIDMQNWDIKPGGFFDLARIDTTHGQKVVAPIRRVLEHARMAGMMVVFTQNVLPRDPHLWPHEDSPWYLKGGRQAYPVEPSLQRGMCLEGSWGAEIVDELAPREQDLVVPKTCYSGFVRTQLDVVLRRRDIRYLFFVGIGTPTCVEATARDAFFHEYWPIILADCCGAIYNETHDQALAAIKRRYGWVATSDALFSSLGQRGM